MSACEEVAFILRRRRRTRLGVVTVWFRFFGGGLRTALVFGTTFPCVFMFCFMLYLRTRFFAFCVVLCVSYC
jgi:hypothetical protein